jgi:hypothetical protein
MNFLTWLYGFKDAEGDVGHLAQDVENHFKTCPLPEAMRPLSTRAVRRHFEESRTCRGRELADGLSYAGKAYNSLEQAAVTAEEHLQRVRYHSRGRARVIPGVPR